MIMISLIQNQSRTPFFRINTYLSALKMALLTKKPKGLKHSFTAKTDKLHLSEDYSKMWKLPRHILPSTGFWELPCIFLVID